MSKETETLIAVGLLLFAALAWLSPLLAAMQIEIDERKKRKDADALALVYCWMLFTWTNPLDFGMEICDTWLPFIFSCIYVAVLSGVIIYKARKRKKAEAEDAV